MNGNEGLYPITDELLKDGQLLVLTFPTPEKEIRAYSFLVKRSALFSKEYTEMQIIDSGGDVSVNKLGENGHASQVSDEGDDAYRIIEESDPLRLYHFGQAWRPDNLKIYWENPNGELVQGLSRDTAISVGDDEGFIWSDHTRLNYKMPTTSFETIIIPGVTPFIGFTNSNSEVAVTPKAYWFGKAYDTVVFNAIDEGVAKDIALGKGYRRAMKTFGGLDPFKVNVPDEWGDPVTLKPEELVEALKGGR